MRTIAGSAGGLILQRPRKSVRPTMDKVRAAIFSSLGERVHKARILDLFAGSGALGIEALSRGATSAVFVEHHGPTARLIKKNLQITRLHGDVHKMDAFRFLDCYTKQDGIDLIFADPPYLRKRGDLVLKAQNHAQSLLHHPGVPRILTAEGLLILECSNKQMFSSFTGWEILSDRNYGETRILILRHNLA